MLIKFLAFLLITLSWVSCSKTSKQSSPVVEYEQVAPKRVVSLNSFSKEIFHDGRGYPKVGFTISLDLLDKKEGVKNLIPRCMQPLDGAFNVGEIRCRKGSDKVVKLTASHFDQVCYRDPAGEIIRAKFSVNLLDCKTSELFIYGFNPEIRVDTEAR